MMMLMVVMISSIPEQKSLTMFSEYLDGDGGGDFLCS